MYDFKNKTVVLTGGASGMGRSFVTHVLSLGGRVSFGDINTALSKSLLLQIHSSAPRLVSRLLFTKTDIRDPASISHLLERTKEVFGQIDCLLCVAGVNVPDPFLSSVSGARENAPNMLNIQINLTGTINTVYLALPLLSTHGRIVIVSSTAGIYPSSVQPLYSASKHGLIGFARALAPLLPKSQRILVLAPSTYLPPHQAPNKELNISEKMGEANSGDVFTHIIRETLGFVEMSAILTTLDDALESACNGEVLEISPTGTRHPAFPAPTEKMALMEDRLRSVLCGSRLDEQSPDSVVVKDEMTTD